MGTSAAKISSSVDMIIDFECATVSLTIEFSSDWSQDFSFKLSPIELEKCDILESQLRDTIADVDRLKQSKADVFPHMSLSSVGSTGRDKYFPWNGTTRKICPPQYFELSDDCIKIKVLCAGLYQVNIRISGSSNSSSSWFSSLFVNDTDVARSYLYNSTGGSSYVNSIHISEVLSLTADDVLSVRIGMEYGTVNDELSNRFTIVKLSQ